MGNALNINITAEATRDKSGTLTSVNIFDTEGKSLHVIENQTTWNDVMVWLVNKFQGHAVKIEKPLAKDKGLVRYFKVI